MLPCTHVLFTLLLALMTQQSTRRRLLASLAFLVRCFFRRVEVTGLENIPKEGGGVLVSWHPNGLVDPALIVTQFPRIVVFGARHGLFQFPILGRFLRALDTVPIHRAIDRSKMSNKGRQAANATALDALAQAVAQGSYACLFPEGDSHDRPHLLTLRTGAARFYYRARQLQPTDAPPPVILPVGLHYDHKRSFRSSVLVAFHPPVEIPAELDQTPGPDVPATVQKDRATALTDVINQSLHQVVHATESWELHHQMHRARKAVRAERSHRAGAQLNKPDMEERTLGFARVWAGYYAGLESTPEVVVDMRNQLAAYDETMRDLNIEDHELDRNPRLGSPWLPVILLGQVALVFLLMPPVLLVGYVINLPPIIGLWLLTKLTAQKRKDEATIKLLFGTIAFPITWIAAWFLTVRVHTRLHELFPTIPNTPMMGAFTIVLLGIEGGLLALRYLRFAKETVRALRVRWTRSQRKTTLEHLRQERARLHDEMIALAEGVPLPGRVRADGRVVSETQSARKDATDPTTRT